MKYNLLIILITLSLVGCAGIIQYPPAAVTSADTETPLNSYTYG